MWKITTLSTFREGSTSIPVPTCFSTHSQGSVSRSRPRECSGLYVTRGEFLGDTKGLRCTVNIPGVYRAFQEKSKLLLKKKDPQDRVSSRRCACQSSFACRACGLSQSCSYAILNYTEASKPRGRAACSANRKMTGLEKSGQSYIQGS